MTVDDVVKMTKAGVSEDVILAQIRAKHASFDLTADQLLQLKSGSVSERVIRAMMGMPASEKAKDNASATPAGPGSSAASKTRKPQPANVGHAAVSSAASSAALRPPANRRARRLTAQPAAPTQAAATPPGSAPLALVSSHAATPDPQSAAADDAAAAVPSTTAPPATPPHAGSKEAPAGWEAHDDPMGFSVNIPSGWELDAGRQSGRISIQGPQGQQAVIWPMFIPEQQLDARGAESLVQQLARRVDDKVSWRTPSLTGNTARVFARGATSAAALMRWKASPDGTAIYLICVRAPSSLYAASVDAFAGVLKSFRIIPQPGVNGGARVKGGVVAAQVSWAQWSDPNEGAFHASVPQGWAVSGGSVRHSATDVRHSLLVLSPDRQIRVAVGDANIGAYTVPNPMYARFGMREGSYTSLGDGSKLQIRRFLPAQQFLREYVSRSAAPDCRDVRVLSEEQRQDLVPSVIERARAQGARSPHVTAAGVSFSCTWNGREARGYYAAVTVLPFPEMGTGAAPIWYVESLYGYLATVDRQPQADAISRRVVGSIQVNAQWRQRENQIAGDAVAQDNARAQAIQARARQQIAEDQQKTSDMIVKGYEERSKAYDEIARRRENAILGAVDVVDPSSGKQYKIDNYSDYHWMNNQGVIAGTKTDTSPGLDWREMITLP